MFDILIEFMVSKYGFKVLPSAYKLLKILGLPKISAEAEIWALQRT